jgi:hypothetical protein
MNELLQNDVVLVEPTKYICEGCIIEDVVRAYPMFDFSNL